MYKAADWLYFSGYLLETEQYRLTWNRRSYSLCESRDQLGHARWEPDSCGGQAEQSWSSPARREGGGRGGKPSVAGILIPNSATSRLVALLRTVILSALAPPENH